MFTCLTGVYFTKYCRDLCVELGIGGWVKNSKTGTIVGKMQGERTSVQQM
jgi:acylphosphatase